MATITFIWDTIKWRNIEMTKYYVEFDHLADEANYCIQSKWFETRKQAIDWFKNEFDFIRENVSIYLMKAEFDEKENCGDIEFVEELSKCFLFI